MTNKKRFFLIISSVSFGTLLSIFLFIGWKGTLNVTDYSTLAFNMFFSLVMVMALAILFKKWKR